MAQMLENTAFSYAVSAAFMWGAVIVVALAISRSPVRPPASIALLMSFLFKGIAVTLSIPSVAAWLDRATGMHNICRLILSLTGGMAWTACVLAVITFWGGSGRRAYRQLRVWIVLACLAAVALIVCWIVAPEAELPVDFYAAHGGEPVWVTYMLLYLGTYALGAVLIIVRCLQYARYHEVAWLRRSLLLTAAGAALCLVFCLLRADSAIYGLLTNRSMSWQHLAPFVAAVGQVLIVIGLAGPSFSQLARAAVRRAQIYRWHRQLEPLWTALYEGNSHIALAPPRALIGDHGYRLYRRIVEIRDGLSAIRPYVCDDPAKTSAAQQIRTAIAHQRTRQIPAGDSHGQIAGEPWGTEQTNELSWLLEVSRELRTPAISRR
ncbi:MAB_1171c family putative transporter [Mycolicibacterium mucogenicum]|uniref:MAB_1171c family putative transporter n=1 Tax=Mycolicibacterium mucogenicum TaxID=56689 RepID=UPI0013F4C424|nr:MAB_1171c family putative transporter [Mycolicibacterium mucogenicum]